VFLWEVVTRVLQAWIEQNGGREGLIAVK